METSSCTITGPACGCFWYMKLLVFNCSWNINKWSLFVMNCNNMECFTEKKDLLRLRAVKCVWWYKRMNVMNSCIEDMLVKCVLTLWLLRARVSLYSASSHSLSMSATTQLTFPHLVISSGGFVSFCSTDNTSSITAYQTTLISISLSTPCHFYPPVLQFCFQTFDCVYLGK